MVRVSSFVAVTFLVGIVHAQTNPPAPEPVTAEAAAPAAPAEATDAAAPGPGLAEQMPAVTAGPADLETTADGDGPARGFAIAFDGYLRMSYSTFTPDRFFGIKTPEGSLAERNPYVGRNDGFALGSARLNLRGSYRDRLYVRLAFDGAIVNYEDPDDPVGKLTTGLKDAYVRYDAHHALSIFAGRFKAPFDIEELTPEFDQQFVRRALESRGVERQEGFAADMAGFAPGRQAGVMLASEDLSETTPVALGYALAITNGNTSDMSLNDNDLPAVYLRFTAGSRQQAEGSDEEGPATFGVGEGGIVGLTLMLNERTDGLAPNRFSDRIVGGALDGALNLLVFDVRGQLIWTETRHQDDSGTKENGFGGHLQVGVRIPNTGLTPAYRIAYLNPRATSPDGRLKALLDDQSDYDRVIHHTVGVKYVPATLPLGLWLDYTHSVEQGARAIPNDRVEMAMQVNFE